jgi:hypothetical protein
LPITVGIRIPILKETIDLVDVSLYIKDYPSKLRDLFSKGAHRRDLHVVDGGLRVIAGRS